VTIDNIFNNLSLKCQLMFNHIVSLTSLVALTTTIVQTFPVLHNTGNTKKRGSNTFMKDETPLRKSLTFHRSVANEHRQIFNLPLTSSSDFVD